MPKKIKQRSAVGILGKQLTRRSKGRCELCNLRNDVRLFELPPFPDKPDPMRTLMACQRCRNWLEGNPLVAIEAHFLSSAVWSELPPVKLAAARLLLRIDDLHDPWMVQALEAANIDPITQEFAE